MLRWFRNYPVIKFSCISSNIIQSLIGRVYKSLNQLIKIKIRMCNAQCTHLKCSKNTKLICGIKNINLDFVPQMFIGYLTSYRDFDLAIIMKRITKILYSIKEPIKKQERIRSFIFYIFLIFRLILWLFWEVTQSER